MDWRAMLQILIAAVGGIGGKTAALVAMVFGALDTVAGDAAELKALNDKWVSWVRQIVVVEHREFTDEEHALARQFADEVHASNQQA